jgi:hypothetical protein
MTRIETWPPPKDWTEIVVSWATMLEHADHAPNDIIAWLDKTPGGCYHLHGWDDFQRFPRHGIGVGGVDGFAFRFENPQDAMLFALRWSRHERT